MTVSGDVNAGFLATVQSDVSPKPKSITTAATIAPTTFLSLIVGTTQIKTITPPVNGMHMLAFIFASANTGVFLTTGNITSTTTTVAADIPVLLFYNPITAKYVTMLGK